MKNNLLAVLIGLSFVLVACDSQKPSTDNIREILRLQDSINDLRARDSIERIQAVMRYEEFWKGVDTLQLDKLTEFNNAYGLKQLPAKVFNMLNLRSLVLDTQLSLENLPPEIGTLKHLEELRVTKSRISYLPKEIGQLIKLKKLEISGGGRLQALPEEIGNLVYLEELNLFRNQLTTLPNSMIQLHHLKLLVLAENNFSAEEKMRIMTALPHCQILFDSYSSPIRQ